MVKVPNPSAAAIQESCTGSAISSKMRSTSPLPRSRSAPNGTAARVTIKIEDNGPGFSPDVIGRVGEPYVTTKTDRRAKSEEGSGLGLGLFIAKTLLERSGATVKAENRAPPETGAVITIFWERADFERGTKGLAARSAPAAVKSSAGFPPRS